MRTARLCVGLLLVSPLGHADDPVCKVPLDAVTRVLATPNHQFITRTDGGTGGKPRESEIIDTGIAMYVGVDGKWRTSPTSPLDMQNMLIESQKRASFIACVRLREDSVGGAAVTVYSIHDESNAGISDTTLWVSNADGLPLKQEIDMESVAAKTKTHSEVRFVYTDVKAPSGVQ